MPPRKIDGSPKKTAEKKSRGQKKVKPVLKTPSIVKVKLDLPTAATADKNGSEVKLVKDVKKGNEKPVTKNNTTVKRKYVRKKIVNKEQAADASLKKRGQTKGSAKNYTTPETNAISEHYTKCDGLQIDENYYKILLANDVIQSQFPNKHKFLNEQPIEQVLQENKTTVKKKLVSNAKRELKKKDTNYRKPAANKSVKSKECGQTKKISKTNTSQENGANNIMDNTKNADSTKRKKASKKPSTKNDANNIIDNTENADSTKRKKASKKPSTESECKPNLTPINKSKDGANNIMDNTKDAEQSTKRKKPSKKPCTECECKRNLTPIDKSNYDDNNIIDNTKDAEHSTKRKKASKKPCTEYDDNNMINPTKNSEQSTKQKQLPKKGSKLNSLDESACKANLTSKNESKDDADNNNMMINPKNAKQFLKRKHKLSLNRKNVKAGPLKQVSRCGKKEREICKSGKRVKNRTKDQEIVTDESLEDCSFAKCVDNSIKKSSVSSVISWTKDISSSSNSSFITVYKNGLHCFDNKMPVVQLNYISENSINNKKSSYDGDNLKESSESVVDSVIREPINEFDKQNCASLGIRRLSRSSSLSSEQIKFNFGSQQNKINNSSPVIHENIAVTCSSLRLSTSSISSNSLSSDSSSSSSSSSSASSSMTSRKNLENESNLEKIRYTVLQKLSLNLKKFDFNKIIFSKNSFKTQNNTTNVENEQDNIFIKDALQDENVLCSLCQNVTKIDEVDEYFNNSEHQETTNIPCPKTPETYYSKDSQIINEHGNRSKECIQKNNENNNQQYCPAKEVDAVATNEVVEKTDNNSYLAHNKSNCNENDDDDALSLYAESLTGLESCKKSSTFNSEMPESEEYVPQPVVRHTEHSHKQITYQPTKISCNIDDIPKFTSICKRQKADSTSILINSTNNLDEQENAMIYEDKMGNYSQDLPKPQNIVTKNSLVPNRPRLMELNHRPAQCIKSAVFKGYCFFYCVSKCRKSNCTFPHVYPNVNCVKNTLERLCEDSFIQEYMLIRGWPLVRRKYGLCFVEECIRRDLTRIVVEIAIDCIKSTSNNSIEDNDLKSEVVDNVLMYLNNVDLSVCDDLLQYNIKFLKMLLCDYFIRVIATSQNFSQFKSVFINLTDFMNRIGRTFSVYVAESILERFCILPYDDLLARALLIIMKNTDVTVFSNAKICDLEKQLQVSNIDLYHEFKMLKDQALLNQPVLDNHYEPLQSMDFERINTNFSVANKNIIRSSPHMTDLVNANKPPVQTTFRRTVNIDKLQLGNSTNMQNKSSTQIVQNPSMNRPEPIHIFVKNGQRVSNSSNSTLNGVKKWQWRHQSSFDHFKRNPNASPPMRPQRPPFKRHSDWSFEGSPTKFKRNSGPNQYH